MNAWIIVALAAGQAATLAAVLYLVWRIRKDAAARELEADRAERLALFERRRAAIAPLDVLHRTWAQRARPGEAAIAAAHEAAEQARFLFPGELADPLAETSALLGDWLAVRRWREAAVCGDRYGDREELLERECGLEESLIVAVAALRPRLAEAARIGGE